MVSPRLALLTFWIALQPPALPAAEAEESHALPRPVVLAPAVGFWTRVYAEIDTNRGFVHDDRQLDVVYEVLRLDPYASAAEQHKVIARAVGNYRKALLALASGKPGGLTETEQRAARAWAPGTPAAAFRAAADRVRFQRGQADRFQSGLARAAKWQRRIHDIFRRQGLPTELAALPHVESSYHPQARSSAGAAGLWQFMPGTARRYLRVDGKVDERLDPYRSSEAAARLLQHNHSVLRSWPLALTAYNHGLAGVRRATLEVGSDDIGEIVAKYEGKRFGFASRNFYAAFLAALDLSRDPESYFGAEREKFGPRPITVTTGSYLPIEAVVAGFDTDLPQLRRLNPRLPRTVLSGRLFIPKGHALKLPPNRTLADAVDRMAQLDQTAGYLSQRPDVYHEVREGETLSVIAERYETDTEELVALNRLSGSGWIRAGQLLLVATGPEAEPVAAAVAEDEPLVAGVDSKDAAWLDADVLPIETQPELAADPADYTVRPDGNVTIQAAETLGHYAGWLGVASKRLRELNRLRDGRPLVIGRRLKLDFAKVSRASFEQQRLIHHQELQASYFQRFRIAGLRQHRVEGGDSLWILATARYDVPLWLLRQYNPDVELDTVLPLGGVIAVPVVEELRAEPSPLHAEECPQEHRVPACDPPGQARANMKTNGASPRLVASSKPPSRAAP